MRYVTNISSTVTSPSARQVMNLSAAQAVKPVQPRTQPVFNEGHPENSYRVDPHHHPDVPLVDRRKACRRVSHSPVLIELRSGIDRRHNNLREGDVAEHIDIEA